MAPLILHSSSNINLLRTFDALFLLNKLDKIFNNIKFKVLTIIKYNSFFLVSINNDGFKSNLEFLNLALKKILFNIFEYVNFFLHVFYTLLAIRSVGFEYFK